MFWNFRANPCSQTIGTNSVNLISGGTQTPKVAEKANEESK